LNGNCDLVFNVKRGALSNLFATLILWDSPRK
jgi:hypothetical protein